MSNYRAASSARLSADYQAQKIDSSRARQSGKWTNSYGAVSSGALLVLMTSLDYKTVVAPRCPDRIARVDNFSKMSSSVAIRMSHRVCNILPHCQNDALLSRG